MKYLNKKKILYVGDYFKGSNASHRVEIFKKYFGSVNIINYVNFTNKLKGLKKIFFFRYPHGKVLESINHQILNVCEKKNIDVVWFEKPIFIKNKTLQYLKKKKIFTVEYTVDNAFGPRRHSVWRLYKKNLNLFDVNLVPRKKSILDYKKKFCKKVDYFPLCYFKDLHKTKTNSYEKKIKLSFVGTPYNDRGKVIEDLFLNHNIKTDINGDKNQWKNKISKKTFDALKIKKAIYNEQYVKKIQTSKINLSFTSYDNLDEYPYRLLEIIMSGGFCLHQLKNNEKIEILKKNIDLITFDNTKELTNKIQYYLNNPKEREKIIQQGIKKIKKLNLDSESRLVLFFEKYRKLILRNKL